MEGKGREYTGKNNKIQSQFSALRDPSQTANSDCKFFSHIWFIGYFIDIKKNIDKKRWAMKFTY
jgi:hypothetical protein